MPNFILFGEIGSGKDTVAEILQEILPLEVVKLGEKIHTEVEEIYSLLPHPAPPKRSLYQNYGESMRETFGQDVWNYVLHNKIRKGLSLNKGYVIADGRQPKEFDYWTSLGFIPVGVRSRESIRRDRSSRRDGVDQSAQFDHYTEVNARNIIQKIDRQWPHLIVENNYTKEDLRKRLEILITEEIIKP